MAQVKQETFLRNEIDRLERRQLETMPLSSVDVSSIIEGDGFVLIRGLALAPSDLEVESMLAVAIDYVIAGHSYGNYLTLVVSGNGPIVSIYFSLGETSTSAKLLGAFYTGVKLEVASANSLAKELRLKFSHAGRITGIPSFVQRRSRDGRAQRSDVTLIDRLVTAMRGERWAVAVKAYPRDVADVADERDRHLQMIAAVSSGARQHLQQSTQTSNQRTNRSTDVTSNMLSTDLVDKRADYLVGLLETEIKRLEEALATGRWQVGVYFGTETPSETRRLGAVLRGSVAGADSKPDPIRLFFCNGGNARMQSHFDTYLSSKELALYVALPRKEAPGYEVKEMPSFDVDARKIIGNSISIGEIIWNGDSTKLKYKVPDADLARHALIVGVTGSGKTTTIMRLIAEARTRNGSPFLVIEPAKTEYRRLIGGLRQNGKYSGPIPDLRIYSLGDETLAPFRINPFEFDCGLTNGGPQLLSHIDLLKVIFNNAFILYAPMPYVLETALHEIYEDKGWNMATGENVRLNADSWNSKQLYPIFPTLSDLYKKVEPVTKRLGYEARIAQDVIAGLRARIGSLRLGSKGLMLDTSRGISISDLLKYPTVLELENIGNDEEKTFLMGLILTRLYSYRRLEAIEGVPKKGLTHILVIEEAHRLLKSTNLDVDNETVNLRAHAVEVFANMLSEIRQYGQGVLVAEQIPSKLTQDVIKNTNLKVVHRLLARDDREALAGAMMLDEEQAKYLAVLRAGEAVAYAEGDDRPYMLRIGHLRRVAGDAPLERRGLRDNAANYISMQRYMSVTDPQGFSLKCPHFGSPDPALLQAVQRRLDHNEANNAWAVIFVRSMFSRNSLSEVLLEVRAALESEPALVSFSSIKEAIKLWIVYGAAQAIEDRREKAGVDFSKAERLFRFLASGLIQLVESESIGKVNRELDRFSRAYESEFCSEKGPYRACSECATPCLYRPEAKRLIDAKDIAYVRGVLTQRNYEGSAQRYGAISATLKKRANQWLAIESQESRGLGYCAGLHIADRIGLDDFEQHEFGAELAERLLN